MNSHFIERLIDRASNKRSNSSLIRALTPELLPNTMPLQPHPHKFAMLQSEVLPSNDPTNNESVSLSMDAQDDLARRDLNSIRARKSDALEDGAEEEVSNSVYDKAASAQEEVGSKDESKLKKSNDTSNNSTTNNVESTSSLSLLNKRDIIQKKTSRIEQTNTTRPLTPPNAGPSNHSSAAVSDKYTIMPQTKTPVNTLHPIGYDIKGVKARTGTGNTLRKVKDFKSVSESESENLSESLSNNAKISASVPSNDVKPEIDRLTNYNPDISNKPESTSSPSTLNKRYALQNSKTNLDSPISSDPYPPNTLESQLAHPSSQSHSGDSSDTHYQQNANDDYNRRWMKPAQKQQIFYGPPSKSSEKSPLPPKDSEPIVTINIGRIEVRALASHTTSRYKKEHKQSRPLSLNDYLKRRKEKSFSYQHA